MAAKYRKIDPRIWDDEVFDALTAADALAVLWLETCRGLNRAGVAVIGLGEAADKLRLQGVDEAWDTLSRVCPGFQWPLQKVGRNTVVVILRTWFKYNEPTNPDHLKGMLSDLLDVPRCDLLSQYAVTVKPHLAGKWHKAFDTLFPDLTTPCGTPCASQKQKLETEAVTETEEKGFYSKKQPPLKMSPYSEDFDEFWNAYPKHRRTDKPAAWNAWLKAIDLVEDTAPAEFLIQRCKDYAASPIGKGQYACGALKWLTSAKWDDPPEAWQEGDGAASDTGPRKPDLELRRNTARVAIFKDFRKRSEPRPSDEEIEALIDRHLELQGT